MLVVGWGECLYLVRLDTQAVSTIDLGYYFSHLYPADDHLLVASGERLFRIDGDGTVAWSSGDVGLDGVIVEQVKDGVVEGQGEWDPPGGWRPFRLSLGSGEPC
jgi:hypothetical protein